MPKVAGEPHHKQTIFQFSSNHPSYEYGLKPRGFASEKFALYTVGRLIICAFTCWRLGLTISIRVAGAEVCARSGTLLVSGGRRDCCAKLESRYDLICVRLLSIWRRCSNDSWRIAPSALSLPSLAAAKPLLCKGVESSLSKRDSSPMLLL